MGTVLIIDDDTEFDNNLAQKLKDSGLLPVVTVGGKEALDYLSNNKVDFIVLDFVMPEMDGDEFYHKLRHDLRLNIPTVVLTNFANIKPTEKLDVFVKTETDLDDFVNRIKESLNKNQSNGTTK